MVSLLLTYWIDNTSKSDDDEHGEDVEHGPDLTARERCRVIPGKTCLSLDLGLLFGTANWSNLPPFYPHKKHTPKSNLCCPYTHRSMVKLPEASLLRKTERFPATSPETINCEELHFSIFIIAFKDSL
ncbi:hypothetical protein STEG23_023265 [Scotinomys teguina]